MTGKKLERDTVRVQFFMNNINTFDSNVYYRYDVSSEGEITSHPRAIYSLLLTYTKIQQKVN